MPTKSSSRNAAETVSRTTAGWSPRPPSQSASGGPFVVVDVVSTPAENPAVTVAPRAPWRPQARPRAPAASTRCATSAHTITPIAMLQPVGRQDAHQQRADRQARERGEHRGAGGARQST